MKASCVSVVAALVMVAWPEEFGLAAESGNSPTPPVATGKVDLDGAIQPPAYPSEGRRVVQPAPVIPAVAPSGELSVNVMAWDASQKEETLEHGETEARFKFCLTNVSPGDVTIFNVHTSCGCTTAHLPPMPWTLPPGTNGEINVTMNVVGKIGSIFKTVTVSTDKGNKTLIVRADVTGPPAARNVVMSARETNQKIALVDRQAVFKGDCARCHATPTEGKMGGELFAAACSICHEAEHRATMVPDLHALPVETSRGFWYVWITFGKTGSLMPGFSQSEGGPLTSAQISSLVDYLSETIPSKPASQATPLSASK